MARGGNTASTPRFGDGQEFGLSFDYRALFTEEVRNAYLVNLPSKLAAAKSAREKERAAANMKAVATLYSTVVYQIYPNVPLFREAIDSDPELSSNFAKAKQWVDANGFQPLSEEFGKMVSLAMSEVE